MTYQFSHTVDGCQSVWVVETVENAEENERCQQVSSVAAAHNKEGEYFSSPVFSSFLMHNA